MPDQNDAVDQDVEQPIEIRNLRDSTWFWVDNAIFEDTRLSHYARLLYCALCRFANNTSQECYPSVGTLARLVGCSAPTLHSAIHELEITHWIAVTSRHRKDGGRTSNVYSLLVSPTLPPPIKELNTPLLTSLIPPIKELNTNYPHSNKTKPNHSEAGEKDPKGDESLFTDGVDFLQLASNISEEQRAKTLPVEYLIERVSGLIGGRPQTWNEHLFERDWAGPARDMLALVAEKEGREGSAAPQRVWELIQFVAEEYPQLTFTTVRSFYNLVVKQVTFPTSTRVVDVF